MEPASSRAGGRRSGFGAPFIVVMAVLVMVSLYGISMGVRSQGAASQSRKAAYTEQCENLAEMAVLEAVRFLRSRANAEGSPVFEAFRRQDPSGTLPVATADLTHLGADLARTPLYALRSLQAEVLRRGAIAAYGDEAVGYDAVGVLRITAAVTGPFQTSATLVSEWDFRSTLAAAPRPFDPFTFYLGDAGPLLTHGAPQGDPNAALREAVERLKEHKKNVAELADGFERMADDILRRVDSAGPLASDSDKQRAQQGAAGLRTLAQTFRAFVVPPKWPVDPEWEVLPPGSDTQDQPGKVHEFAAPLTVYSMADTLDLASLNLPARIEGPVRRAAELKPLLETAFQALRAALDQAPNDPAAVEPAALAFLESLRLDATAAHELVGVYKAFQDALVELSGPEREQLNLRARRLNAPHQEARAHFRFSGPGSAAKASHVLSGRPPPSGYVWVDDSTEDLVLSVEQLEGRLVVASRGRIKVQQATVKDPTRDAIVLLGYGGIEVGGGTHQAAFLSWGGKYQGSGESFAGSLVLDTVDTASLGLVLAGTVTRQPALLSAAWGHPDRPPPEPTMLLVLVGPEEVYRRIER